MLPFTLTNNQHQNHSPFDATTNIYPLFLTSHSRTPALRSMSSSWLQAWTNDAIRNIPLHLKIVVLFVHCPIESNKGVIMAAPLLNDPDYRVKLDPGQLEAMDRCATIHGVERVKSVLEAAGVVVLILNARPEESNCVRDPLRASISLSHQLDILKQLNRPINIVSLSALVRDVVMLLPNDNVFIHSWIDWHFGGMVARYGYCKKCYPPHSFEDTALFRANVLANVDVQLQSSLVLALFEPDGSPHRFRGGYKRCVLSAGGSNYVQYDISRETSESNPNNLSSTGGVYGGDDGLSLCDITSQAGELYSPEAHHIHHPRQTFPPPRFTHHYRSTTCSKSGELQARPGVFVPERGD